MDGNPPRAYIHQVTAQSFLNFGIDPAAGEVRTADQFYEQNIDGQIAIRAIHTPAITHPWAHFSTDCVAFGAEFFDRALVTPNFIPHDSQIWQWKAAFNALGIVGFFMFVVFAALALLDTPCFAVLKAETPVEPWPARRVKQRSASGGAASGARC